MRELLSTQERLRLLKAVIFKRGQVGVNETATQLALSKGLVSKYLDLLARAGMAKRYHGKFVIANASALVKGIKIMLNLQRLPIAVFKKRPFIQAAGLYGSCAKGENTEESDMDIWIRVGKAQEKEQAALSSELNRRLGNAKVLFLPDGKLERLKQEDELFYHALAFGSITVYGGSDALQL